MDETMMMERVRSIREIRAAVDRIFLRFGHLLPSGRDARILLKPNLNAAMNALTGNTTDLRLCAAVIEALRNRGYRNITIADGSNSGYYRNKISVLTRLRIDALARYYGIGAADLNYAQPVPVLFEDGVQAGVARECVEADLFINLPKLKTHFEMGMSCCLKNLMGCMVGQENKKKVHKNLARNILHINEQVKPHLHIIDGMIAMEGLGPTRGMPVHLGLLIAGTDPVLLDLLCARLARFDYRTVGTLRVAEETGLLTARHHALVGTAATDAHERTFLPPKARFLARFIHHPSRQKYFLAIRNTKLFSLLCSTGIGGKILYATGLRQDVFTTNEVRCDSLSVDRSVCKRCGRCRDYCPLGKELPDAVGGGEKVCLHCLYCFMVCPERAIRFEGELGFVQEQLRQYDEQVRKIS